MAQLSATALFTDPTLRAYYQFESGGSDSIGSNTLTNNNSIAFDTGEYGNGADTGLSNTNKYLSTSSLWLSQSELAANWSVAFWVNFSSLPNGATNIISEDTYSGSNNRGWSIFLDNTGHLVFNGYPASNGESFTASNTNPITTGVWHHIAATWTAGAQKLYVDGILVATDTQIGWGSDTNNYHNNTQCRVFYTTSNGTYEFASAIVDDLGIFTKVLSQSEVNILAINVSPSSSISASLSPSASRSPSASNSPSASISPSISPSASRSPSASLSPSGSISASPSPSIPISSYSRQVVSNLPTNKNDLATTYTPTDVNNVAADDGVRVDLEGTPPTYLIHQFKFQHSNHHDTINVNVVVQSTEAASISPVYLQIWNVNSSAWETIAIDSESNEDINFQISGVISSNLSNYYDELYDLHFPSTIYQTNEIAVRIYQQLS